MKSRIYGAVMVILSMSMAAGAKVIYVDSVKAPTVQGMVGFWDMNDNAATQIVTDSSVNANHGTAVRNTSEMTIPGKYGRALNFNGTSDFVDLGTNSLLLPDAWTLVAWVKCQVMDSPTLFSFGRTDLTVRLQNGGKGKPVIMMGSNNYKYFTGSAWTTLQDGQWHFVVFSVPGIAQTDIQNAKMYLDGVPVTGTTVVATGSQQTKSRFLIGTNTLTGTQRYMGGIDYVKLYNRALTDLEVKQIYQSFTPGVSWLSTYRRIDQAVTASVAGDQIWVRKGTYTLTAPIAVNKAVAIYGGFAGTETELDQRDVAANPTIINGNNVVVHAVDISANATLDGFTVTGGNASGATDADKRGGGIYAHDGKAIIARCIVTGNNATNAGGGLALIGEHAVQDCQVFENTSGIGAGLYLEGPSTIDDSDIHHNIAGTQGGGIFVRTSPAVIGDSRIQFNEAAQGGGLYFDNAASQVFNCTVSNNESSGNGGGLYNNGGNSESKIRDTLLAGNTAAGKGGALYSGGGSFENLNHPQLTNCILVQNQAQDGGALYFDQYASGEVLNCTISGNHAQRGGGMFVFETYSYPRILNTILWNDISDTGHTEIYFAPTGGTGSKPENLGIYYSTIMTGWDNVIYNIENLDLDPAFVDADGLDNDPTTWEDNDYRIPQSSPMIDKGTAQLSAMFAPNFDILGVIRPQGTRHDIGAYEYASGQGLEFQADFDLDYSYTAPALTQSFAASTQSCDVTWWLGLTNSSSTTDWIIDSVTFETPNTLGHFFPSDPTISGNQYIWSNLTVSEETELEATQTTVKKDVEIPFSVTRAYEGNAITGSGEMTTTVTVTPQAGLASFGVKIGIAPAWTEADWWNGLYIGTVEHLSAEVTGNTTGQLQHRDTPELQEYEWQFSSYDFGQPIVFTIRTQVDLSVPTAYLEPRVSISGNRTADYGSENWENGTLILPNDDRVIIDSSAGKLTLDGYLPWYELILPHFAEPINGDANNDGTTDIVDLLALSENWLTPCNAGNNFCNGTDFDHNGKIDLMDFAILSETWLK